MVAGTRDSTSEVNWPLSGVASIDVLAADRDLAGRVDRAHRLNATRASRARLQVLEAGDSHRSSGLDLAGDTIGILVLDGLVLCSLGIDGRRAATLAAPGDIVAPSDVGRTGPDVPPRDIQWRVLAPTRVAILDRRWMARMAPYPEVGAAIVERALAQAKRLGTSLAINQQRRLDTRILLTLWQLADRLGRVHKDGVHVAVPLRHAELGHLVLARRPSVSVALARLSGDGLIEQDHGGWILRPDSDALASVRET